MKAVMLMAYGSPRSLDEVEEYYTHIRGGRKPSEEQVEELKERYRRIGGSPLIEITRRQAEKLEAALSKGGAKVPVYAAMKHSHPFISEVVKEAEGDGVDRLLCIVLAPHYSRISTGGYEKSVAEALSNSVGIRSVSFVKSWHDNPLLVKAWVKRLKEAKAGDTYWPVFTAHSLPERILREGDPYVDQLMETSRLVASSAGLEGWSFAFQSQSKTGEPWLGPDIIDHMEERLQRGNRSFLAVPVGFVSDHLEILYDLDVECVEWARRNGVSFRRCSMLNDSDDLVECLASVVKKEGFA